MIIFGPIKQASKNWVELYPIVMSGNILKMIKLNKINANYKLGLSVILAVSLFIVLLGCKVNLITSTMISLDFFNLIMILINWLTFFTTSSAELAVFASNQDETLPVGFILILIIVCFSLFGTVILLMNRHSSSLDAGLQMVMALGGVALSWVLLHTIFTLRYAHLFYIQDASGNALKGLDFGAEKNLDYIDFAYFSFVIGMTFQVSDIRITSKTMRRFVMVHSVIAFVFNTLIVALTINTIANV